MIPALVLLFVGCAGCELVIERGCRADHHSKDTASGGSCKICTGTRALWYVDFVCVLVRREERALAQMSAAECGGKM
jgi:hypothetical protein